MLNELNRIVWLITLVAVWFGGTSSLCAQDWKDYVDDTPDPPPVEEVEYDPAWDKYAFDLPFADNSGRLSFEDLARSGEPFVLYWWLTECPMCHLQLPYVEHLQNQVDEHELGLSIVGICIDGDKRKCLKVMDEKNISFPVLIDERARRTKEKYKKLEQGAPQAYLFGAGGELKGTIDGFQASFGKTVFNTLGIELPEKDDDTPAA